MPDDLVKTLMVALQVFLALLGGFLSAFHLSLVIWTFRDIRSRSRDAFAHLLAAGLVLLFSLPGLLLYLMLRPRQTLAEQYERALEEEALLQDIEERLVCPGCQRKIEPDFMVCPSCQTQLKARCAHCGRLLHPKWVICPYCATRVVSLPEERVGVEAIPTKVEPGLAPAHSSEGAAAIEPREPTERDLGQEPPAAPEAEGLEASAEMAHDEEPEEVPEWVHVEEELAAPPEEPTEEEFLEWGPLDEDSDRSR
ncbi:MAG: double zinc ribbon domain-containing protein [Anaerolineae bacterium]